MLCVPCHGRGLVQKQCGPEPCSECGGSGILHCCEGLMAQPGEHADSGDERANLFGSATDGGAEIGEGRRNGGSVDPIA